MSQHLTRAQLTRGVVGNDHRLVYSGAPFRRVRLVSPGFAGMLVSKSILRAGWSS